MSAILRFDEPFAAAGGIGAKAAQNALGRPHLGRWEVFLRESLQNSWDARRSDEAGIVFSCRGIRFGAGDAHVIRDEIFADRPSVSSSVKEFLDGLESSSLSMLVVEDARTHGLAGPTQGDVAVTSGERSDYRDFVMSYGRDEQKGVQGGAFGLGKAALYNASTMRTCLIYSQTADGDGNRANRFIAIYNGSEFQADGKRFTGRRYWGCVVTDGLVAAIEPVGGDQARALATKIGLTTLEADETGTSIGILNPVLEDEETLDAVVEAVQEAALKWAWPHMVKQKDVGLIDFRFSVDGQERAAVNPASDDRYKEFVWAYQEALAYREADVLGDVEDYPTSLFRVVQKTPKKNLGVLALTKTSAKPAGDEEPLRRHVALMRKPKFVVRYLEVPEPAGGLWLRGCFLVNDEYDEVFGRAEPPTHDDWVQQEPRSGVKRALEIIREKATPRVAPTLDGSRTVPPGLVQLSQAMGALLTGTSGSGLGKKAGAKGRSGSGQGSHAAVTVRVAPSPRIMIVNGLPAARFDLELVLGRGADPAAWTIIATPFVVVFGGGREGLVPLGAGTPEVLGWCRDGDDTLQPSGVIPAAQAAGTGVSIFVTIPERSSVGVDVHVVPNEAESRLG